MKTRSPTSKRAVGQRGCRAVVIVVLWTAVSAWAQVPVSTPASRQGAMQGDIVAPARPASAASAARPGRRYLSADEKRDSATTPGDLRPSDPVVPQIRIPIGRNAANSNDGAGSGAGTGGIDDDAARCRAQMNAADRARCGAGAQKLMPKPSLQP